MNENFPVDTWEEVLCLYYISRVTTAQSRENNDTKYTKVLCWCKSHIWQRNPRPAQKGRETSAIGVDGVQIMYSSGGAPKYTSFCYSYLCCVGKIQQRIYSQQAIATTTSTTPAARDVKGEEKHLPCVLKPSTNVFLQVNPFPFYSPH